MADWVATAPHLTTAIGDGAGEQGWRCHREALFSALSKGTVVGFVGAGCSTPLGYPSWSELAQVCVHRTLALLDDPERVDRFAHECERLRRTAARLDASEILSTDRLLNVFDFCKSLHSRLGESSTYYDLIGAALEPPAITPNGRNPHDELVKLPIRRFITTNYDGELSASLKRSRGRRTTCNVFTQATKSSESLALFSLSQSDANCDQVFHCHGHYKDPMSMVVAESDYRYWYLGTEREDSQAFYQTLELLLGSNPILFVGYGLGDEDLLRALRVFLAQDSSLRRQRPLFALMPSPPSDDRRERYEIFAERYGVRVIPFAASQSTNPQLWGDSLCLALKNLHREYQDWLHCWQRKPLIRRVAVSARKPDILHHYPLLSRNTESYRDDSDDTLTKLARSIPGMGRLIILLGRGGTGKSWMATRLMERLHDEGLFDGYFFWSSYYSDDALTGLDRALRYMDPDGVTTGSRLERLRTCLREKRIFLVFDGVERLLTETDRSDIGRACMSGVDELFRTLAECGPSSTVVLTSRLQPEVLSDYREDQVECWPQPQLRAADLAGKEPFAGLHPEDLSALCSLLDGHAYAIRLAAEWLRGEGLGEVEDRFKALRSALNGTPFHERIHRLIEFIIDRLEGKWHGLAYEFLQRISVFMSPLFETGVEACFHLACRAAPGDSGQVANWHDVIQDLLRSCLVFETSESGDARSQRAYTLHPIVRGFVFQRYHHAASDDLPNFTLPGFTAGNALVDPGKGLGARIVTDLFNELCDRCNRALSEDRHDSARELARCAFGVIRSRMTLNTCARWSNYHDYLSLLVRLTDVVKSGSDGSWDYAEQNGLLGIESPDGLLYAEELAWLYNELGLTYYAQGSMKDALEVWEQSYEINRLIDNIEEGGQFLFQAQCNLGAAYIHLGKLQIAHQYLKAAERTNLRLKDDDHAGRITGYLGLIDHLRGDLLAAQQKYASALKSLRRGRGNPRAESIVLRHLGDALIGMGKLDAAKYVLRSSRTKAEVADYPDLVAYSRLAYGHLLRQADDLSGALREYNVVLSQARSIGIHRLEAEAMSELSRLALDLGDFETAKRRALDALQLSNRLSLGLRQTHGLVVFGLASVHAGQRRIGISCLQHAKAMADRQQYALRGREAEEILLELGEGA